MLREQIFEQVDGGLTFSNPKAVAELEGYVGMAMEVVEDPELREKLRPQHPFGCKRPLLSNDYYPAFNRPNLELVTEGIARITPSGIATVDGVERRVDTLIYATGFETTQYASAIDFRGRGGEPIADAWRKDGAAAYLGITTAGFPNLFMLYGPNTNNGSLLTMLECQVEYALQLVRRLANEDLSHCSQFVVQRKRQTTAKWRQIAMWHSVKRGPWLHWPSRYAGYIRGNSGSQGRDSNALRPACWICVGCMSLGDCPGRRRSDHR